MFMCVLFPFYLFLHSDIIDLAYLKSLILKIILCIRMHSGGITAAPRGASCSSRDTESQGCCHPSSPGLLPRRCWCRYCYCKTGQGTEMHYSKSATLHWPKGHSFADILGQNR